MKRLWKSKRAWLQERQDDPIQRFKGQWLYHNIGQRAIQLVATVEKRFLVLVFSFFNRPKIKPILQCISQKHLWMCDMKEGTLHDSHMLVYADAAFPVLHLSVVWRCSCRSSRKARLSQHRLESLSKSLRQPLSAQQTLRQPLLFFGGWLQGRRADAMSRLWSEPRLRRTPGGRSEDKYVTWWKLWDAREASWSKAIMSRKRLCKLFTLLAKDFDLKIFAPELCGDWRWSLSS